MSSVLLLLYDYGCFEVFGSLNSCSQIKVSLGSVLIVCGLCFCLGTCQAFLQSNHWSFSTEDFAANFQWTGMTLSGCDLVGKGFQGSITPLLLLKLHPSQSHMQFISQGPISQTGGFSCPRLSFQFSFLQIVWFVGWVSLSIDSGSSSQFLQLLLRSPRCFRQFDEIITFPRGLQSFLYLYLAFASSCQS